MARDPKLLDQNPVTVEPSDVDAVLADRPAVGDGKQDRSARGRGERYLERLLEGVEDEAPPEFARGKVPPEPAPEAVPEAAPEEAAGDGRRWRDAAVRSARSSRTSPHH